MPNIGDIEMGLSNDFIIHIKLHRMCENAMMRSCWAKAAEFLSVTHKQLYYLHYITKIRNTHSLHSSLFQPFITQFLISPSPSHSIALYGSQPGRAGQTGRTGQTGRGQASSIVQIECCGFFTSSKHPISKQAITQSEFC